MHVLSKLRKRRRGEKRKGKEVVPGSFLCPTVAAAALLVLLVEGPACADGSDHTTFLPNESLRCLI